MRDAIAQRFLTSVAEHAQARIDIMAVIGPVVTNLSFQIQTFDVDATYA